MQAKETPTQKTIDMFHNEEKFHKLVTIFTKCMVDKMFTPEEVRQAFVLSERLFETAEGLRKPDIRIIHNSFNKKI